jgi:hypothetical protein
MVGGQAILRLNRPRLARAAARSSWRPHAVSSGSAFYDDDHRLRCSQPIRKLVIRRAVNGAPLRALLPAYDAISDGAQGFVSQHDRTGTTEFLGNGSHGLKGWASARGLCLLRRMEAALASGGGTDGRMR